MPSQPIITAFGADISSDEIMIIVVVVLVVVVVVEVVVVVVVVVVMVKSLEKVLGFSPTFLLKLRSICFTSHLQALQQVVVSSADCTVKS